MDWLLPGILAVVGGILIAVVYIARIKRGAR